MAETKKSGYSDIDFIKGKLIAIESRLTRLEAELGFVPSGQYEADSKDDPDNGQEILTGAVPEGDSFLESKIGEYGLAWIGNIVLLFGIIFLTGYLQTLGLNLVSALSGYLCAVILLLIVRRVNKTLPYLGSLMKLNGHLLLFYITLRLHFFSADPLIQSEVPAIIIVVLLLLVQAYIAIKSGSQLFWGLVLTLTLVTAMVSDTTHFMLPMVTLVAAVSTWLLFTRGWKGSIVYSVILVYICILLWFLNNPFMSNPVGAIGTPQGGIFYLFAVAAAFTQTALLRQKGNDLTEFSMAVIILNGMGFTTMLTLIILQFYSASYVGIMSVITVCCLLYSIVLQKYSEWKYAPAFYALYGFTAMSIALYGIFGLPEVFLTLAVQSLLVVTMALWFRNKIIVYLNALLLVTLIIIYFATSDPVTGVNVSFALVAIISARVLNFKKQRLEIETEILRNFYLISGFFLVLYAIYHWVPSQFVTLSWSTAAILYFVLSLLLKNPKYRIMALGTIIATVFYLFIVDLKNIDLFLRVLAFLFLSVISILVSIYYTRRRKRED